MAKASRRGGYGSGPVGSKSRRFIDRIAFELDLLARNAEILQRVASEGPIGIIRMSSKMRLPLHKVRYSLHILEAEGMIRPTPGGAVVTERGEAYEGVLGSGLERVTEAIEFLKERVAEERGRPVRRRSD